jgi:hypothetical protein
MNMDGMSEMAENMGLRRNLSLGRNSPAGRLTA